MLGFVTAGKLTGGLVMSKAPMAILNPDPSPIRTFSFGILTSSKVMPLVSEHLWPMFISYRHKNKIKFKMGYIYKLNIFPPFITYNF